MNAPIQVPQTLRDRLLKIRELSLRGVDGEREAAERKLQTLLAQNGLSVSDLDVTETRRYWFTAKGPGAAALLIQIVAKMTVVNRVAYGIGKGPENKGRYCFDLTPSQYVDVNSAFIHYLYLYRRESRERLKRARLEAKAFGIAFYHKFSLHGPQAPKDGTEKEQEPKPELLAAIIGQMRAMRGEAWLKPAAQIDA